MNRGILMGPERSRLWGVPWDTQGAVSHRRMFQRSRTV